MKYNTKSSLKNKSKYKSQKEWIMRKLFLLYKNSLRTKVSKEEKKNFMIKTMESYWIESTITIKRMKALK